MATGTLERSGRSPKKQQGAKFVARPKRIGRTPPQRQGPSPELSGRTSSRMPAGRRRESSISLRKDTESGSATTLSPSSGASCTRLMPSCAVTR